MHSKMFSYHHQLFLVLSLTSLLPVFSDLAADRSALLRLQSDVGGQTLRWNTSADSSPCLWRGVTCSDNTTGRVTELRLPGSGLRGALPPNSVGNLTELRKLSLRSNALSGELPSDLASCTQLQEIHLQGNSFSGEIPVSLFSLKNLLRVNLARNRFSGEISPRFDNLTNLRTLYLENNQLTGTIPNWNSLANLTEFNVSFNGVSGSIPSSLRRFPNQAFLRTSLCGRPLSSCSSSERNKLSDGAIAGIAVGSFVALLLILCVSFVLWRTNNNRKVLPQRSPIPRSPAARQPITERPNDDFSDRRVAAVKNSGGDLLVFFAKDTQIFSLQELLSASAEVMGKGMVGSTYKAYFESGIQVIVKRLKNVCVSESEFRSKIEEIGALAHRNLQPLRGYFYGREEKLLLYEPMPNGSLAALLHGYGNNRFPSLEIRARIAVGAAAAIEYLHSAGATHGNIKSSNIFLTGGYDARVAEFGLARLVSSTSGLSGYRAPEVADTRSGSREADVYGLGVVLLELLTCREPDRMLAEEGVELPDWVQTAVEEKGTNAAVDPRLLDSEEEDGVVELLFVALSCTSRDPAARPTAAEVARRLRQICEIDL